MPSAIETLSPELRTPSSLESGPLSECFGPAMELFPRYTFPRLFEERVASRAEQLGVLSGDERLSFGELNARANQLARYLRARGAGPETLVGICLERSLEMVIGILGILKSGAAYLPLDPEYPGERLSWMLKDSNVSLVLTSASLAAQLSLSQAQCIALDTERTQIDKQSGDNLASGPAPDDLAYVIYTSGSTGEPKGVMIDHGGLANYLLGLQQELEITDGDRYLHTASIAFSSSRRQLLLPLSQGATVVIASSEQRKDPLALFEMIKRNAVTVMDAVPSFWRNCTAVLSSLDGESRARLLDNQLRLMLSASEPLRSDIPDTWIHDFGHPARHVHMFGQTETAGIVCVNKIVRTEKNSERIASVVPVGRPIANTEIYILDEEKRRLPVGIAGELYIGGAGVGRGYLNRPELTLQKFLDHPFSNKPGARLYRTGDWARLRADGLIEFAGRRDSQVKVRGFRIELGEIETILARHRGVNENAVVALDDGSGTMRLIAYFVPSDLPPTITDLRAFMTTQVPEYMVPSLFVQLEALPLNANGKLDRKNLPEPAELRPQLETVYRAPRTPLEEILAGIWSEVLKIERIGVSDNFFELGGHSLLATQVVARINQRLKTTVPLRILFDGPTISELAQWIEIEVARSVSSVSKARSPLKRIERGGEIPLSSAQQRLWFIDQLDPGSSLYNINRAFRLQGTLDAIRLEKAVQLIAARHESLRTTFVNQNGHPVQQIAPRSSLGFQFLDLRSLSAERRESEAQRIAKVESAKPFDLARGPLARVTLLSIDDKEHVLLLSIHHIIADAWALTVFFRELEIFYHQPVASTLPELQIQYADFAEWQRERLGSEEFNHQLDYWKKQLGDAPTSLDLPTDYPRSTVQTSKGAQHVVSYPTSLSQSLKDLSRQEGVTLFMTLLTAFQILLAQYCGQDDLLVGVPVAGRTLIETEGLVGCFINTLVLRGNLSANPSFREVIKRTREAALEAYTNQEVPFEKLVEELRPERSLNRSPLVQVLFALQNETRPDLHLHGINVQSVPMEVVDSKFELSLEVVEKAEGLDVSLSYSVELFHPASIAAILDDFEIVLRSMVADPAEQLSHLPALNWMPRVRRAEEQSATSDNTLAEFVAPRTPIEERVAAIWSEILGVERIGVHDNFFALGGHSLLAAQVTSRVRKCFAIELPLRRIFETPTVAGLAGAIYETQANETSEGELAAMLAELSQLSDEEAQRQFAEEF